jgi:chromosome segregation ATPase
VEAQLGSLLGMRAALQKQHRATDDRLNDALASMLKVTDALDLRTQELAGARKDFEIHHDAFVKASEARIAGLEHSSSGQTLNLAALSALVDSLSANSDVHAAELSDESRRENAKLAGDLASLSASVDSLSTKNEALAERLSGDIQRENAKLAGELRTGYDTIAVRIDDIDKEQNGLRDSFMRLQQMPSGAEEIRKNLEAYATTVDLEELRTCHDTLSGHIVDIIDQQSELRESQVTTTAQLSELDERTKDYKFDIGDLTDSNMAFHKMITQINERLGRHREDIERLRDEAVAPG